MKTIGRQGLDLRQVGQAAKQALRPDEPYVWLIYLPLYTIPWFWRAPTALDLAAAAAALPVFLWLYLTGIRLSDRRALPHVAGIVLLSFALSFTVANFAVVTVYAAAVAGHMRPARLAGRTVAAVAAALGLFGLMTNMPPFHWVAGLPITIMVGVSCMFSASLEAKNRELEASRDQVRTLAAAAERERIARDLHDLLGHTLTVVAVKSELAAKLVTRDPTRAVKELEELNITARTALADIRAAVSGMRSALLGSEVAQVRGALAAVNVVLSYRGPQVQLPPVVEDAVAMLLREGATNVVRHARAGRCEVAVDVREGEVLFTLRDDGIGGTLTPGNGITGMRDRVAALGGSFHAEGTAEGTCLTARIPLRQEAPADAPVHAPALAPVGDGGRA